MPATELFVTLLTTWVGQSLSYFAVVGLVFLVTRRLLARRLSPRRIETRGRKLDRAQLAHEVRHSLAVLALGAVQAVAVLALHDAGWTRITEDLGPWGLPGALAQGVGLLLLNDLWFYSIHRLLHTKWLFKHVHSVHHRSVDVNPLTSYSFHAIEAVLVTGWVLPVALLVPLSLPVLMVVQLAGLANNVMAHLGYELLPSWWVRTPLLRWTNTATFHSLHHSRFKGNYGLLTRTWDHLFQTELSGYEDAFAAAHRTSTPEPGPVRL